MIGFMRCRGRRKGNTKQNAANATVSPFVVAFSAANRSVAREMVSNKTPATTGFPSFESMFLT
jgi:hypothetical protein